MAVQNVERLLFPENQRSSQLVDRETKNLGIYVRRNVGKHDSHTCLWEVKDSNNVESVLQATAPRNVTFSRLGPAVEGLVWIDPTAG